MNIPRKLYGIIGYPLGHSRSPQFHNWAFREAGLPDVYMAWPTSPHALPNFIQALRTLPIAGLSITLPHKQSVVPLLDQLTESARRMGAVNTLFWEGGELWGDNTDIVGFMTPLQGQTFATALVLGAGGAARAVVAGLQALGTEHIVISNHNNARAQALAREFQVDSLDWEKRSSLPADIIVNATPLGMKGPLVDECPYPPEALLQASSPGIAYDLVYTPLRSRFLQAASAAGWYAQDGLDMFVAQAQEQFRLWTGQLINPENARKMLLESAPPRSSVPFLPVQAVPQ